MLRSLTVSMVLTLAASFAVAGPFAQENVGPKVITHETCKITHLKFWFTAEYGAGGKVHRDWYESSKYRGSSEYNWNSGYSHDIPALNEMIENKLRANGFIINQTEARWWLDERDQKDALLFRASVVAEREPYPIDNSYTKAFHGGYGLFVPGDSPLGTRQIGNYSALSKRFKLNILIPTTNRAIAKAYDNVIEGILNNLPTCQIAR